MSKSRKLGYTFSTLYLNDGTHELADDNFHPVKPSYAGDLKYSVQSSDHNGWLKCDGRSLNRVLYANLFEVIGTAFGNDDSETFKLPDCRGRVLGTIGSGSGLTARSLGAVVGAETHTLTVNEMPSHSHTSNATGGALGLFTQNGLNTQAGGLDATTGEPNLMASPVALTINDEGNSQAHNNMQPTIFISNIFVFAH